jgi:hypothetical protein
LKEFESIINLKICTMASKKGIIKLERDYRRYVLLQNQRRTWAREKAVLTPAESRGSMLSLRTRENGAAEFEESREDLRTLESFTDQFGRQQW